ncbi:metallophosphoesterase [Virgibacillus sp. W0430]|uniref:metallophosphoesterase n=1 Tax=Virgibacillus sp. W0430 TaxID=3391580 RepID=UPI003F484D66
MRTVRKKIRISILLFCLFIVFYTIWDNQRIKIVQQDIEIDDLPVQLDRFSILQITDLHEKEFGLHQKKLLKAIKSLNYDAIVFTGDMVNYEDESNAQPFFSLLNELQGVDMFFVLGNADPPSHETYSPIKKSEFIRGIEERGVKFVEAVESISVAGAIVHFVAFELSIIKEAKDIGTINGVNYPSYVHDAHYKAYQTEQWQSIKDVVESRASTDTLIALTHYPIPDQRVDYIANDGKTEWVDYDLIIAGHYHGGQIRLPFIGALFVPDPWYESKGFFPPRDRVNGLWEVNGAKQYVSTGLGSSESISVLNFRLFNPPEINLLTLKRAKETLQK